MGKRTRYAYFPVGFNTSYIIGRQEARLFHLLDRRRPVAHLAQRGDLVPFL